MEGYYDFEEAGKEGSHWNQIHKFKELLMSGNPEERPVGWLPAA